MHGADGVAAATSSEPLGVAAEPALFPSTAEAAPVAAPVGRRRRIVVWIWGIASLIMFGLLAGQATYLFRTEIAVAVPASKPWLVALCEQLGCEVDLPRRSELLSVEASDLHPQPGRKDWLVLAATLKSRAEFPMSYPHLELTLTDAADRAVVRRVFSPREYLKADADIGTGLQANADLQVSLVVEAAGVNAAGYRLYVFYP